ncbi:MAG TPA: carotenoid oxygenase family protein [Leptolyngbyaceae cyanobacterium M33_DOE_097]|uniref:Uncharacterized protein n=1 Tax=Oscillatoriales cyanobacterium SpSt-418 TaxID=2282169 RepID=A0A7C3PF96_9CYAN|nr:carotenoid oxygenase family protein [Leptolyngbyaceae cyanobacterium M33_DOE_097]
MVTTVPQSQTGTWAQAIAHKAQEFAPIALSALEGTIPNGLRGALYRNGPAFLERAGERVAHWFDGDGGILAVHFADQQAIATYRYVRSAGFLAEEAAGEYLFAGYGMLPKGNWLARLRAEIKNAANTSVLALPDRLLALWEGGMPHALSLDTLETKGLDDLAGLEGASYSAHPKRDPKTGDIFNFGVALGARGVLNLFRSDATGKLQQRSHIFLDGLPLIHDFVLAGRYLIFCVPPVRLNPLPIMLSLQSYCDSLKWQPQKGTEILVVDRDRLELVSRFQVDPWFQWHFSNGCELPDGSVSFALTRYADFQTNEFLREVPQGQIHTVAPSPFWQVRIDPRAGKLLESHKLSGRSGEFPVVNPQEVGQPFRYSYLSLRRQTALAEREMFGAIARFDHQTGQLDEADLGENRYPCEPIYVSDAENPEQGWVLTVVYDGTQHTSELWIFAADNLAGAPHCRLALPEVIPPGFHGTWKPAS